METKIFVSSIKDESFNIIFQTNDCYIYEIDNETDLKKAYLKGIYIEDSMLRDIDLSFVVSNSLRFNKTLSFKDEYYSLFEYCFKELTYLFDFKFGFNTYIAEVGYNFGSSNSRDNDYVLVLDEPISLQFCKLISNFYKKHISDSFDINFVTIENKKVSWCFKGTKDELNNCLYYTSKLNSKLVLVERDIGLKIFRTLRGIISYTSRTEYRKECKEVLRSNSIEDKISYIRKVTKDNLNIFVYNGKTEPEELFKFLSVQIIQTLALMNNKQLFTKNDYIKYISSCYPKFEGIFFSDFDYIINNVKYTGSVLLSLDYVLNDFLNQIEQNISYDNNGDLVLFDKTYNNISKI